MKRLVTALLITVSLAACAPTPKVTVVKPNNHTVAVSHFAKGKHRSP